jgi:hypothetical protein
VIVGSSDFPFLFLFFLDEAIAKKEFRKKLENVLKEDI